MESIVLDEVTGAITVEEVKVGCIGSCKDFAPSDELLAWLKEDLCQHSSRRRETTLHRSVDEVGV